MVPLLDDVPGLIGRLVCNISVVYFAANFVLNSVEGNRTAAQNDDTLPAHGDMG